MKLFVPACGDRLVLSKDWTFTLYFEHRNTKFAGELGLLKADERRSRSVYDEGQPRYGSRLKREQVTLPAGTVLECDRIYIRTQAKSAQSIEDDYDSITWKVLGKKNSRFWVKLNECNSIEFELQGDASFKERVKEEASKPKRMDADAIREALLLAVQGSGPHVQLLKLLTPEIESLYEESLKFHEKAYELYVKDRNEYIRKAKDLSRSHGMFSRTWSNIDETVDKYYAITKESFTQAFFKVLGTMCAHSKLGNGTHVRKFSWREDLAAPYSWCRTNTLHYALAGLSFSVMTDADDLNITGMKVNFRKALKPND